MPSALTRLTLRRERRSILAWSLGGGCLTLYCILMFNTMYATVEERQAAALTYSTPAAAVFTGPGFGMDAAAPTAPSMGALSAAQALGWLAPVAALMGVLLVCLLYTLHAPGDKARLELRARSRLITKQT